MWSLCATPEVVFSTLSSRQTSPADSSGVGPIIPEYEALADAGVQSVRRWH
jgi:hypothetical protein